MDWFFGLESQELCLASIHNGIKLEIGLSEKNFPNIWEFKQQVLNTYG